MSNLFSSYNRLLHISGLKKGGSQGLVWEFQNICIYKRLLHISDLHINGGDCISNKTIIKYEKEY